jgi:hypothetical protein
MSKRQFAYRPYRQAYKYYKGILGIVVGISEQRESNNGLLYEVKCADCGEIHLRNAKHLKQGIKSQDCKEYHPPNYIGLEKRDLIIRNQYGITLADYNDMLEAQDYKCAICRNEDEVEGRRLAIDHCHTSGKVRGLLCGKCNRGLGLFYDNQELLSNAIKYLTKE